MREVLEKMAETCNQHTLEMVTACAEVAQEACILLAKQAIRHEARLDAIEAILMEQGLMDPTRQDTQGETK